MKMFKNSVGRPSNNTLRKRKIIKFSLFVVIVLLIIISGFIGVKFTRGDLNSGLLNLSSSPVKIKVEAINMTINKPITNNGASSWVNKDVRLTDWRNYKVKFNIKASSTNGNIKSIVISWNDAGYKTTAAAEQSLNDKKTKNTKTIYSNTADLQFEADGIRYGYVTATDVKGKTKTIKLRANIDRTAPSIVWKIANDSNSSKTIIEATCSDNMSGVRYMATHDKKTPSSKIIRNLPKSSTSGEKVISQKISFQTTKTDNYIVTKCIDKARNDTGEKSSSVTDITAKVTITFDKNGASSIGATSLSCNKLNNTSCTIKAPKITPANGFEVVGWSTDSTSTKASILPGKNITIKDNTTYYAITKSKTAYKATFDPRNVAIGNEKTGVKSNSACYRYNGSSSCKIKTPSVKVSSNQKFLGWSTNNKATSATIKAKQNISLKANATYYAIIKETLTVTFDKNLADSLSFTTASCTSYGAGCVISKTPHIYRKGYAISGLSKNILNKTITKNMTVSAKPNTGLRKDPIEVATTYKINGMAIEVEKTLDAKVFDTYYSELEKIYKKMPYLFDFKGKIHILSKDTYSSGAAPSSSGRVFGSTPYTNMDVYITDAYQEYKVGTFSHELGHAFDYYYGYMTGKNISKQSDVLALYNEMKKIHYKEDSKKFKGPMRNYSYTNSEEFVADLISYYYYDQFKTNINHPRGSKMTAEMRTLIKKYIKIAEKGYK